MTFISRIFRSGIRAANGLSSRWRNVYYRVLGVRIVGYAWLRAVEIPRNWSAITIGRSVSLDRGVVLLVSGEETPSKLVVKAGTYINRYTIVDANHRVEIGQDCM